MLAERRRTHSGEPTTEEDPSTHCIHGCRRRARETVLIAAVAAPTLAVVAAVGTAATSAHN